MSLVIKVKKLVEDAQIPTFGSEQALGADLYSVEELWIPPGEVRVVSNGIAVEPNMFCDMQVRPRSGLAAKNGVTVLNAPGTVDPDYRGELKTILINHGKQTFRIEKGMRIAQLVALHTNFRLELTEDVAKGMNVHTLVTKLERAEFVEALELSDTVRGQGGFGSTGVK